jgi:hypothetical protein
MIASLFIEDSGETDKILLQAAPYFVDEKAQGSQDLLPLCFSNN